MRLGSSLAFLLIVLGLHDHEVHQVAVLGDDTAETGVEELQAAENL